MSWIPAVAGAVGAIGGLFSHHKRPNVRRAIAELQASRPTGYLTPEDMRAAEQTRGRLNAASIASGTQASSETRRRFIARGLAGSPSEERSQARIQQQEALGAENAGNTAEEQLYNLRTGREAIQHQQDLAVFNAQVGDTQREQQRQDAEHAAYWNSLTDLTGPLLSYLPKSGRPTGTNAPLPYGPPAPTGGGGFDPAAEGLS